MAFSYRDGAWLGCGLFMGVLVGVLLTQQDLEDLSLRISRHWQPPTTSALPQTAAGQQTPASTDRQVLHSRACLSAQPARAKPSSSFYTSKLSGFYVMPGTEQLVALATQDKEGITDKVTNTQVPGHNYETLYSKLFELGPGRSRVHKILEIGLGCGIRQGAAIGTSARLWRRFFPAHTEIWIAEFDAKCVEERREHLKPYNVHFVTGDQGKPEDLKRWINETGGGFDVIIDDGGHYNWLQGPSLRELFQGALKPGGVYIIEDTAQSAWHPCDHNGTPPCHRTIDMVSEWVELLSMGTTCVETFAKQAPDRKRNPFHGLMPGIKSIEVASEMVVITKCFLEDKRCYYDGCMDPAYDATNPWKPTAGRKV